MPGSHSLWNPTPPSPHDDVDGGASAGSGSEVLMTDEQHAEQQSQQPQGLEFLRGELLSNPLFVGMDDETLREQLLRSFRRDEWQRDDLIIRYGGPGDRFFIIEEGEAAVEIPHTKKNLATAAVAAAAEAAATAAKDAAAKATGNSSADLEQQIISAVLTDENRRVDVLEHGSSFGEVSLLYDVPRSASVRCLTDRCVTWSVDGKTFLDHSKRGSLMLHSIFMQFASVQLQGPQEQMPYPLTDTVSRPAIPAVAAAVTQPQSQTQGQCQTESDDDAVEHRLMTLADFMQAIEYSKGLNAFHEAKKDAAEDAAQAKEDENIPHDKHYFQRKLARLLRSNDEKAKKTKSPYDNLSPQRLRLIFRLADASGDNLLTFGEFVILHSLLSQPHSELQLAFRLFDSNKNGYIERGEFIAAIRALAQDRGEKVRGITCAVARESGFSAVQHDARLIALLLLPLVCCILFRPCGADQL